MTGEHSSHHRISIDDRQVQLLCDADSEMEPVQNSDWRMDETTRIHGLAGVNEARRLLQSACERSTREQLLRSNDLTGPGIFRRVNPRSATVRRKLRIF